MHMIKQKCGKEKKKTKNENNERNFGNLSE